MNARMHFSIVALLALPLVTIATTKLAGIPLGAVLLWLVLIVLVRRSRVFRPAADRGSDRH